MTRVTIAVGSAMLVLASARAGWGVVKSEPTELRRPLRVEVYEGALDVRLRIRLPADVDPGSVENPAPLAGRLEITPTPFARGTEMRFSVSPRTATQPVELTVVDAAGRRVRSLVRGKMEVGEHRLNWDGCDEAGRLAPSGVYFAKLHTVDGTATQKVVLAH